MLLYWLPLVIFICALLGGRVSNLAFDRLQIRKSWLAALAVLFQVVAVVFARQLSHELAGLLLISGYCFLLVVGWLNRHLAGMRLLLLGFALNFLVITANGGVMPTTLHTIESTGRVQNLTTPLADQTASTATVNPLEYSKAGLVAEPKLLFLGDIIVVPLPGRLASALSVGDLIIALGLVWFCYQTMQVPKFRNRYAL